MAGMLTRRLMPRRAVIWPTAALCSALAAAAGLHLRRSAGPVRVAVGEPGGHRRAGVHDQLAPLLGAGRADAVRQPEGTAGLPSPRRAEDHPGPVGGAGHRAGRQQQGDLLVNPGGPGGSGLALAAIVAAGPEPHGGRRVQHHRLRPARRRARACPRCTASPSFFAGVRPDYIPANAAAEQVLIGRAKTYAADCERGSAGCCPT